MVSTEYPQCTWYTSGAHIIGLKLPEIWGLGRNTGGKEHVVPGISRLGTCVHRFFQRLTQ